MQKLSKTNVQSFITRFEQVPHDGKPLWGQFTPAQMMGHVAGAIRYCLGEGPEMNFAGSFKTKYVYRPLILYGIVQIPRNVPLPKTKEGAKMPVREGDIAGIKESLDLLLNADGKNAMRWHPYFGDLGIDGWLRFHAHHMDHHLRQFGK